MPSHIALLSLLADTAWIGICLLPLAIVAGVRAFFVAQLRFAKVGIVISTLVVCAGIVNYGYEPLYGAFRHTPAPVGCILLVVGALFLFVFLAIEQAVHYINNPPPPSCPFPVIQVPPDDPAK